MADATATATILKSWQDGGGYHARGTIAIEADPKAYVSGGIAFNLAGKVKASKNPQLVVFNSKNGYQYSFVAGATLSAGKLKILASTTEASVAAIPAGVSGDTITFEAHWAGML